MGGTRHRLVSFVSAVSGCARHTVTIHRTGPHTGSLVNDPRDATREENSPWWNALAHAKGYEGFRSEPSGAHGDGYSVMRGLVPGPAIVPRQRRDREAK